MSEDFEKKRQKQMDKKWAIVKQHYEKAYRVKFKTRLSDAQIEELYKQLEKLECTVFLNQKPNELF